MNRLVNCLKQNLIQLAFQQCAPSTSANDFTFCFNYCETNKRAESSKKIVLKSIQQLHGASYCGDVERKAKKFKLDNVSQTSTASSRQRKAFKYSNVTIRYIGNNSANLQSTIMSNNKRSQFTRKKQVNKFNSNIKVIGSWNNSSSSLYFLLLLLNRC